VTLNVSLAIEAYSYELQIGKLQPFCYVDFEARKTELHLHTFAAYPDQVTMIKTQSLFDFSTT
jgi:hypothetical protein